MSNYSKEDIKYMEEILNKIKNKELLSRDDYYWLIYECDIYTEEGDNDGYYEFNSTLSKLNNTYTLTNWDYDLTGDIGNKYEYPIIVKSIKTEKVPSYRHVVSLEDGSSYMIETNDPNL